MLHDRIHPDAPGQFHLEEQFLKRPENRRDNEWQLSDIPVQAVWKPVQTQDRIQDQSRHLRLHCQDGSER